MTPGRKGREDGQWAKRVGRELGAQRAGELGARVPKVGVGQRGRFPAFNQSAQAWPRGPCQAVWKIQRNPVKTVARPCPCLSLIQGKSNPCTTDFPLRAHTVFLTSTAGPSSSPTLGNSLRLVLPQRPLGLCPSRTPTPNALSPDIFLALSLPVVRRQRGLPWALLITQQWFCVPGPCLCLVHTITLTQAYY